MTNTQIVPRYEKIDNTVAMTAIAISMIILFFDKIVAVFILNKGYDVTPIFHVT
jgi:membrane glycosyltransferase